MVCLQQRQLITHLRNACFKNINHLDTNKIYIKFSPSIKVVKLTHITLILYLRDFTCSVFIPHI